MSLRVGRARTTSSGACPIARDEALLQEGAEIVSDLTTPFTEVKRSHERPPVTPTSEATQDGDG